MKKSLLLPLLNALLTINSAMAQGSLSATYTIGDIPTSVAAFDPTCNGNNITLSITLPAGDSYMVTGVDVRYNMTAISTGQKAHQRSQLKCVNTSTIEPAVYSGNGASTGTMNYRRSTEIANGTFPGNTRIDFEMHAWRVTGATTGACNVATNRVDAGTWVITLHYGAQNKIPKVGINDATPKQALDVNGKLKIGNDIVAPTEGTVRWNSSARDFEGYDGAQWLSLTNKTAASGWGSGKAANESDGKSGSNPQTLQSFGYSVDIHGDLAIVGIPNADVASSNDQGMIQIYYKGVSDWIADTILTSSDGTQDDHFGISVGIMESYVIVGAQNAKVGTNHNQGKAYIFQKTGNVWNQQAIINARGGSSNDLFGCSVSISEGYIAIGAKGKKVGANTEQGAAYTFSRGSTGQWEQQSTLSASNGSAADMFGSSVCISDAKLIVGAPGGKIGYYYQNTGYAYIFNRSGETWAEETKLSAFYPKSGFGQSVSINANHAIVGVPKYPNSNSNLAGAAYVFNRTGSTWTTQATLSPSDGSASDDFGYSVAIDGIYAVVGARLKRVGGNEDQGKAYIFKRNGTAWNQVEMLLASDGGRWDSFGAAVSISYDDIIIGAFDKSIEVGNSNYSLAGKVYFFNRQ